MKVGGAERLKLSQSSLNRLYLVSLIESGLLDLADLTLRIVKKVDAPFGGLQVG